MYPRDHHDWPQKYAQHEPERATGQRRLAGRIVAPGWPFTKQIPKGKCGEAKAGTDKKVNGDRDVQDYLPRMSR